MSIEAPPRIELYRPSVVELPIVVAELSSQESRVKLSQPNMHLVRGSRELLMDPADVEDKYREREMIALGQEQNRHPQQERFAIFLKDGSDLVGGIQMQPSAGNTCVEIRYYLDDQGRQQGHLADAIILLRDYAVSTLGYGGISTRLRPVDAFAAQLLIDAGFIEKDHDAFGSITLEFKTTAPATPAMELVALERAAVSTPLAAHLE